MAHLMVYQVIYDGERVIVAQELVWDTPKE
jgi:hypothetical protein